MASDMFYVLTPHQHINTLKSNHNTKKRETKRQEKLRVCIYFWIENVKESLIVWNCVKCCKRDKQNMRVIQATRELYKWREYDTMNLKYYRHIF